MEKIKILFLCTGNSARSQIAEGLANALTGGKIEAYSAGIKADGLNPLAAEVMAEINIDISHHQSKLVSEVINIPFDYVITLCRDADETCPLFPGKTKVIHAGFLDPVKATGSKEEKLGAFRQVRDKIKVFINDLPKKLKENN